MGSSVQQALQRVIDLHRLGYWTNDKSDIVVFAQRACVGSTDLHDCSGAVLTARPPSPGRLRHRKARPAPALACIAAAVAVGFGFAQEASAETWRGLTVAPESRCSPYDKKRDYPYPQSVERDIVRELGAVYGPYTGRCFVSKGSPPGP